MLFANPHWLWLLMLAPLLALMDWRTHGARRRSTALLRGVGIAALALALSRPLIAWHDTAEVTVAVVDLSPAVGDAAIKNAIETLRSGDGGLTTVVAFSGRAEVVSDWSTLIDPSTRAALRTELGQPLWSDDRAGGAANLADALRLAGAQIPADAHGRIRLFATGRSDHGDAAAESWRLAQRGITVVTDHVVPTAADTMLVKQVLVPPSARIGQTVRAEMVMESKTTAKATIRLTAGKAAPQTVTADVVPGLNRVDVDVPLTEAGLTEMKVAAWTGDAAPADAAVLAAIVVNPPAKVLLVQDVVDANLLESISAILGPSAAVTAITPAELANQNARELDAVILADLPADRLPAASQGLLRDAVAGGTGLLVTGAARSFGPGGYEDSQLAALLPVKMPQQMESIDPSTTLVLIIDTSGSMKGDRIDLAKEVSRLALSHLKPHDKAGIVEFYGGKRWAAPIQSAGNLSVIHRALDRLTAGGGTTLFPAVEEAAFALRNVRTRSKHVLICSDGFVENAPFAELVRQMADDGIVVSTAQIAAADGMANMMPDIARWGGGRFYTVPDQYALPDLSFKQPQMSLTSPLVRTVSVLSAGDDPLIRPTSSGDAFGTVDGYVRTQARPTADVLLKTEAGDPLLVRWRYGAGFVAALPTQLGSTMTASLQDRPAFANLLADLFRQIGSGRGLPLRMTTTVRPAGIEADVTAVDAAAASAAGTMRLTATDAEGKVLRTIAAEAIAPGHWNVLLPGMTAGAYTLRAELGRDATGDAVLTGHAGVAVAPPQAVLTVNTSLLDQIGGFRSLAAERSASLPPGHLTFIEIQKILAAAAALLLLAHVAVRRWPVGSGPLHSTTS